MPITRTRLSEYLDRVPKPIGVVMDFRFEQPDMRMRCVSFLPICDTPLATLSGCRHLIVAIKPNDVLSETQLSRHHERSTIADESDLCG